MEIINEYSIFDVVIGKRNGRFRKFLLLFKQHIEVDELPISTFIISSIAGVGFVWFYFRNVTFGID